MMKFETPEIKVVRFDTPDILTLSANASYEGVKADVFVAGSEWAFDEEEYML